VFTYNAVHKDGIPSQVCGWVCICMLGGTGRRGGDILPLTHLGVGKEPKKPFQPQPLPQPQPYHPPPTQGGYSTHIISDEHYTYTVPNNLDIAGVAPLLCAGITTYSPYKLYGLDKPGLKIGVVGLGGLVSRLRVCVSEGGVTWVAFGVWCGVGFNVGSF